MTPADPAQRTMSTQLEFSFDVNRPVEAVFEFVATSEPGGIWEPRVVGPPDEDGEMRAGTICAILYEGEPSGAVP